MRVLSIDLDYIMGPVIELYNGLMFNENPTIKQLNISSFKKGFGGITITKFAAEKIYDKIYAEKILNQRIINFLNKY